MSRVKKKRPTASGFSKSGKQCPFPCLPGQRAAKDRPKRTYSTRPHDYLRRRSEKCPEKEEVVGSCAVLPALVIPPCGRAIASPSAIKYHQSCSPTPIPHSPRTGHSPQRDFDSYALRYLAEKAISHSRKYAEARSSEREREGCRRSSCSPPPLKTRHKHYCGQTPYRRDRTMLQMVSNAVENGFDALRSLFEDGPIGDSARCCRRRIKRLLRPIWCNCLRHTCLGPPADPIQRYVLTRRRTARDFPRNREHIKKFPRLPTPMPCSPQLSSPERKDKAREAGSAQVAARASSDLQLPPPKALRCAICSLLKPNESPPVGHEHVFYKLQLKKKKQKIEKRYSPKPFSNKE